MKISRQYFGGDYLIAGGIVVIGLAEIAHLTAVFLGRPFSDCAVVFSVSLAVLASAVLLLCARYVKRRRHTGHGTIVKRTDKALFGIFVLIVFSQLLFIAAYGGEYRQGDMTVETVNGFLTTDAVYSVNPMTGQPYTGGMPLRLKILCLPTFYACVSRFTGLPPQLVIRKLIPVVTLLSCYTAYGILARVMFREERDREKRFCFLIAVALLLWAGNYMYGMDGFGVLSCGYRGVTIRNNVLIPWLLSLCLRKKWLPAVFCILAEACIVWTLYGLGVCAAVTVGMAAAGVLLRPGIFRKEAAK